MKNRLLATHVARSLLLGLVVFVAPLQSLAATNHVVGHTTSPYRLNALPVAVNVITIDGKYSGQVMLTATAGGVYSDTLVLPSTPTQPDLGNIDLTLQLSETGSALSGYVDLEKTLVFSTEHTLAGTTAAAIGPYVRGSFDGATLMLESEQLATVIAGRNIKRQFRLTGTVAANDPNTVRGEYRETVWGYARLPITVLGNFTLNRPARGAVLSPIPPGTIRLLYLPLIRR